MNRSQRMLELASALRPLEVRNYAESRNWQPISGVPGRQWVLNHGTERLRQVQIPMDAGTLGYEEAMLDVVRRFADIESREPEELLADLQHPDADTLRFRVVGPETQGGQLSLAADISLREGARRALLAAASSVVSPALYHPRLSRSQAEQLVRASLAGQTELGSYVIKILCPLSAIDEPPATPTLFDPAPAPRSFVRQTTTLLMRATSDLAGSIEQDSMDELVRKNREQPTLSWNLCDALIRMRPDRGRVDLSVSWAADPSEPPPHDVPVQVSFPSEYFPQIEKLAERLRPPPRRAGPSC